MVFIFNININLWFNFSIFAPENTLRSLNPFKTNTLETKEVVKTTTGKQKIQLVKGAFSPAEASDIICGLIDEKINFHKLQRLTLWEGEHNCQTEQLDGRILELEEEKRIAKEFISRNREQQRPLKITGTLEITLTA